MVNSTTAKTILPTIGRSWAEYAAIAEDLLQREPIEGSLRGFFEKRLIHARNMDKYCKSLGALIDHNKKKPLCHLWPEKIEAINEYGTMFEMNLRAIPPVRSSAKEQSDSFQYTCFYFDDELVLVEETGLEEVDLLEGKAVQQPHVVIFNRLSPEIEEQLKAFFQGGN